MYFLFFMHTHIPHSDATVIFSLCTSCLAIWVSTFNVVVSHPNHFDPLLLKNELNKRKRKSFRLREGDFKNLMSDNHKKEASDSVKRDSLFDIEDSKHGKRIQFC